MGRIFDQRFDRETSKDRIFPHGVAWLAYTTADAAPKQTLESLGYHEDQRFHGTGHAVVKFICE